MVDGCGCAPFPPPRRAPPRPVPDDAPVMLFLPAHDEAASLAQVLARIPATCRWATPAAPRRRRRFDRRHGGDRPTDAGRGGHLAGQPRARRRRAHGAAAGGRAQRRSGRLLRRRRRVRARGDRRPGGADPRWHGGLRRRQPVPRPHRPHARPPARRQPRPHRRPVVRRPAADHGRAERLPGVLAGGGRRRRGDPRLQLRPGPDAGPAGQGLPVRRGPHQLPLPHHGPQLRHARSLPAAASSLRSTASSTRPDPGGLPHAQQPSPLAARSPRRSSSSDSSPPAAATTTAPMSATSAPARRRPRATGRQDPDRAPGRDPGRDRPRRRHRCRGRSRRRSGSGSATGIAPDSVAQETDNELVNDAVEGYRAYLQEQIDTMHRRHHGVHRRRPGRRHRGGEGGLPDLAPVVGADRADRRADRGHRHRRRRPRGRLRRPRRPRLHRLAQARVPAVGRPSDVSEAAAFADQLDADLQTLADAVTRPRAAAGRCSRWVPRS